jgi:DNA-binding response OmpR family regulator
MVVVVGELEIAPREGTVRKRGEPVDLTPIEFRLLLELVRSAGHVVSRQTLAERVWQYPYLGTSRLVDMAVTRLRQKIEDRPERPRLIVTVRGRGYRFEPAGP